MRLNEGANAAAVVLLLNFVPPAVELVFDHRRFFDEKSAARKEIEQCLVSSGNCREKLPSGKNRHATGRSGFGEQFRIVRRFEPRSAQPRMHGSQQALGDWG